MHHKITQFKTFKSTTLKWFSVLSLFLISSLSFAQDADPITNLTIDNSSPNVFVLNWTTGANTSGFNVYLNDNTNGNNLGYITSIASNQTSYTFSGLVTNNNGSSSTTMTDGNHYTFTVQSTPDDTPAIDGDYGDNYISESINAPAEPAAPTGLMISQNAPNEFILTWDADAAATGGFNVAIVGADGSDIWVEWGYSGGTSYTFSGTYGGGASEITIADGNVYEVKLQALPDSDYNAYSAITTSTLSAYTLEDMYFEVYPNPVIDVLTVKGNQAVLNGVNMSVFSITGQLVKTSNSTSINVSDIKAGLYLVSIQNKLNQKITKRFVKN